MNNVLTNPRKYRLKARADRQRQTRDRIVAATEALHREVGPARTTIADIARRAGVQRLTVYNHFPGVGDLLSACQGHFLAGSPPPDIAPGSAPGGAVARLAQALGDLYAWYRANEAMERNVNHDRYRVPELDELLKRSADLHLDATAAAYAELIGGRPSIRSMVRLALEFRTWEMMAGQGMTDTEIADLFCRAVACLRVDEWPSRATSRRAGGR